MHVESVTVPVTTASDGSATAYSTPVTGRVISAHYNKTDFDNGSTFTITSESSGQTIWVESGVNATATRAPRQATHLNTSGAAAVYAGGGSPVLDHIAVAKERIKVVIASGGANKSGSFTFLIG